MALPVVILGDSHVRYMSAAQRQKLFARRKIAVREVGGATAVGMRNPNAMTNAIGQFQDFLKRKKKKSIIVIHLGEVDCGYVIWYRADKYNETVAHQLDQSVAAYFEFVDGLLAQGFKHIVITGATLPTITDGEQAGEVVKLRSAIRTTQRERTDLTITYNARLKEQAERRHLPYTDITASVVDPETGLVKQTLRSPDREDHHMNVPLAGALWACRLNECFETYDQLNSPVDEFAPPPASFVKKLVASCRFYLAWLKKCLTGRMIV
jgi:hypothetical protein